MQLRVVKKFALTNYRTLELQYLCLHFQRCLQAEPFECFKQFFEVDQGVYFVILFMQ